MVGSTPYLFGRTLTLLNPSQKIIFFPLSGTPNSIRSFGHIAPENELTPQRHQHFQKLRNKLGVTFEKLKNGTTYFLDVIISGRGLSFLIHDILMDRTDQTVPDFRLLNLYSLEKVQKANVKAPPHLRHPSLNRDKGRIYFPSKGNHSFTASALPQECYFSLPIVDLDVAPPFNQAP